MTLRLILLRHAKSSWDNFQITDHDRPLNDRGRKSADAIGKWLQRQHHIPNVVLCSTAKRTVETWKLIEPHLSPTPDLELNSALYHASPATMIRAIARRLETCVMVIAHNPGIAELAERLVTHPPDHPSFYRFPTASTCVIEFESSNWSEALDQRGTVKDFVVPRDLI